MALFIGLVFLLINMSIGSVDIREDTGCHRRHFEELEEMFVLQEKDPIHLDYNWKPYENGDLLHETWEIEVPFYSQNDEKWKNMEYGKGTMRGSGCIPTAVAMVLSFAGHETNPVEVAKFAINNDHVVQPPEYGTKFSLFSHIAKSKGLKYEEVKEIEDIFEHLRKGRPVVVVGKGIPYNSGETSYGHAMVVKGFREGVAFYVHDPNDPSEKRIPIYQMKKNLPSVAMVIY